MKTLIVLYRWHNTATYSFQIGGVLRQESSRKLGIHPGETQFSRAKAPRVCDTILEVGIPGDRSRPAVSCAFIPELTCIRNTRIFCVQVRTRPIRDGLDAVLQGLLTYYF